VPGGAAAGFAQGVYGIAVRQQLFPGEDKYFRENPQVTGMAAEDDKIVLNPYSKLGEKERQAVMLNEAARVHMRRGLMQSPRFMLTPEQEKAFSSYGGGKNIDAIRQTIAARLLSGDPSALKATPEQLEYVQQLRQFMGVR
jgi:hypothetical protein